ncbi:MAG TPA: alpha/beta hydrolase [Candidatus Parabacteroides intestinavium]|nr:alpha/beta hydrolase [Candidatus Parabacteroides intestinavium]
MKKLVLLLVAGLLAGGISAQQMEELKLYPDNEDATLYVYHPEKEADKMPAILICPGGGYAGLAIDNEGHNMAKWYAEKGLVAAVLKYRLPQGNHTIPLSDAEKGMEILKEHAEAWHVNAECIGVAGSSAGGHLAASLSTLAADENRPAFAVLYYPVISFENMITHGGSKENLLGKDVQNKELVKRYTLQEQVDEKTPPTILLLSDDDTVVPVENSLLYYEALHQHKIPAALYLFPNGGHGWGTQDYFLYKKEAKELIYLWLKHNGIIK